MIRLNLVTNRGIKGISPFVVTLRDIQCPTPAAVLRGQLVLILHQKQVRVWRVLEYLAKAELRESDVWLRDDIRVAYKTVVNASLGMSDPWIQAFCSYYGRHPRRAIPFWLEREAQREEKVGPGMTASPKKPVQSVRLPQNKKEVA